MRIREAEVPVRHGGALERHVAKALEHRIRLAVFAFNGTAVLAAGLIIQIILVRYAGLGRVLSYIAQTIASVQMNFLLLRFVTGRNRDVPFRRALASFNVQQLVVTGLGIAGYAGMERLGINYIVANVAVTAVLTPASFLSRPKWSLRERTYLGLRAAAVRWPLLAVLAVQAGLSLRLVWSNTAFQDEALYLWTGRLEWAHWLHGTPVPAFPTYFSGAPTAYPPLGALADSIGGLAAARMLSLAFMLAATMLLHGTARRLFGYRTATAATALFAVFGAASQLGAFATYDAMAVFLTALAAWLVVRADGRFSEPRLICAGGFLALADAVKYASALWNPVIIVLAALTASAGVQRQHLLRAARLTAYTAIPVVIALHEAGPAYLHGIIWTTLNRQVITRTAPLQILDIAGGWLALLLLLGILGVWLAWYNHGRPWSMPAVLLAAGLLAPAEQARIGDITSLHKHVVFGAWFLCVIAGYAVSSICYLDERLTQGAVIGGVFVGVFAMTGFAQASSFMASWPSLRSAIPALSRAITTSRCPCLIFQEDAAHYYLPSADLATGLTGPYSFAYASVRSQSVAFGVPAMAAAIGNGYFAVVEVDASRGITTYQMLTGALDRSGQYTLMSSTPWGLHPGEPTRVWVRTAGGAR